MSLTNDKSAKTDHVTPDEVTWPARLEEVYPELPSDDARELVRRFRTVVEEHAAGRTGAVSWSERDVWLISYPDQFVSPGRPPLQTLSDFVAAHLGDAVNGVHLLPFFPWTSDDGYSISDYRSVEERYGSWSDISAIAARRRVMVDAVINHMSARSSWFVSWQDGDPKFDRYFRTADPDADLSGVVRAREHPLLTPFRTVRGTEWVWTTFSPDQVDLDYRNPEVLAAIVEVLLDYASKGVAMIRLDAVCFLAKEEGTPSIHLPQTHAIVRFLRACLDATYPEVGLISETNVPHEENISYLGDGDVAEAQAVYQFSLPPLVLHSYATGDASALSDWARQLEPPPPGTTFLNFLASHDGVGLRPLEGLLDRDAVDRLADLARASGGLVNLRGLPDGTSSPYELNATWYDLIRGSAQGDAALNRHLGSHAIMLAMRGIPAVYVHSFFAGMNDLDAIAQGGQARAINRHKFDPPDTLEAQLGDPESRAAQSLAGMEAMLRVRRERGAFHPDAPQRVLETPREIFGIERQDPTGSHARVYVNVSGSTTAVDDDGELLLERNAGLVDGRVRIGPWGMAWVGS